jgi:opacity protein-like surface antigen
MNKLITVFALLTAVSTASAARPYAGAAAGYLIDSEEAYVSARFGFDVAQTQTLTHSLEGEIGVTSDSEEGISLDIVPVMLNYRATASYLDKVELYSGVGAGVTALSLDVDYMGFKYGEDETTFSAQAFVGAKFNVSSKVSFTLGARYIWINDAEFLGEDIKVGDDVSIEAGIHIKF